MFVLKLPPFFTRLNSEGKRAAILKSTLIWTPSSRSYIVFALAFHIRKFQALKKTKREKITLA